jgi:HEAT repeat protein
MMTNPVSSLRRRVFAGALALAFFCKQGAAWADSRPEQDAFTRQSLEAQAGQIRRGDEAAHREYVAQMLSLFGKTGNTAFLRECSANLSAREALAVLTPLLQHTNADVRFVALDGLLLHKREALPALTNLLACLSDPDERVIVEAADGVSQLGKVSVYAVPALQRILLTSAYSAATRRAAAGALGEIGPPAQMTLAALDAAAHDPHAGLALTALVAAGEIRRQPPLSCEELETGGPAIFLGAKAYRALEATRVPVCPPDESAGLMVHLLASHPPAPLRVEACRILGKLAPDSLEAVNVLFDQIEDPEPLVAQAAADAMDALPAKNPALIPVLIEGASQSNGLKAILCARFLARFGPDAASAAPAMLADIGHFRGPENFGRSLACLAAVRATGTNASGTRSNLSAWLTETAVIYTGLDQHHAKQMRAAVLLTLADVGPTADALPAVLDELANSSSLPLQAAAVRVAGLLQEQGRVCVPRLCELLNRVGLDAAVDLDNFDALTEEMQPVPGAHPTSVCLESIRALRRLGPAARPALAVVRQRAADPARPLPYFPPYQREAAELADALAKMQ